MNATQPRITYVGGPTALLELGGLRLLTDPTFDAPGGEYRTGPVVLNKLAGPALQPADLKPIDIVLLSHDHHFDNLDREGRELLPEAKSVLTTVEGAQRLGGNAVGLAPWQSTEFSTPDGRTLIVTAAPARHGPVGGDRGPVVGFILAFSDAPDEAVYVSGDTVWYEGVAEIARRYKVRTAVLFLGAARVRAVGPDHVTMTAEDAIQAAKVFPEADIVPVHFEGWAHFSEGYDDISKAFAEAGLTSRLKWIEAGSRLDLGVPAVV